MKVVSAGLVLAALSGARAEHPIAKVINLLQGLKDKAIAQGKQEAVDYQKFQYWCTTNSDELNGAIADEKETITELTDKLAGLKKEEETLNEDISTLEGQLKDNEASALAAKKLRKQEQDLYNKANKDLQNTIKSVGECISALEGAEGSTEKLLLAQKNVRGVMALISLKATEEQVQTLQDFADPKSRPDQLAKGDLDAHVDKYDFKSENVIELLKQLKMNFQDEKLAGTKAETNAVNSYDLAKKSRDNEHKAASTSKAKKTKTLGETEASITKTQASLDSTNDDKKADTKSLKGVTDACNVKKTEWDERSKTRSLEIEAMDQAAKILAKSAGVRTEAPGNPVPPPSPAVFLQLSGSDPKMKAVVLLRETAKAAHSNALDRLATEIAAHLNSPFDSVNNMIEKMIFRLMDEQKKEDEHKMWCDQELKQTNVMKTDKEGKIDDLKADIKVETAAVGKLTDEIKDANEMIAKIVAFKAEATEIRETGKSENKKAVKDSELAQTSLTNAIAVLTSFYKESGAVAKEPWEFIQAPVGVPKNPATWGSESYTSVKGSQGGGGIIAILETVMEDFAKMEADTKAQEASDKAEYDTAMSDNDIEKAERTTEVEMKTAEMGRRNEKIASLSSQKKETEGELEKTNQYLEDLKPACVSGDSSYDDRKAARETEVVALKKAQGILEDAFKAKKASAFLQMKM